MNALVKLSKLRNDDIHGLIKFYDDIESNIRSLSSLGVETSTHVTLIATLILEILPQEIKVIARNVKETWDLTKILDIVNQELGAREACAVKTAEDGKNGSDNYERFLYTGLSLHISSWYRIQGQKFANIKCVFCGQGHWSDKCSLITDPKARKNFLREKGFCFLCLKSSHVIRNCSKKETC